jgi:hypothetical protein
MTHASLTNDDWNGLVERLGGAERLEAEGRATKAFVRPREVKSAVDMLRLVLAYCLGEGGLRLTAAWSATMGLADISNPALLHRLRQSGDWLASLVGRVLAEAAPKASDGRLIRIVDGTTVAKAGAAARKQNGLWRIHSAFDLPQERFGHFALTDQSSGEQFDRIAVVPGEIRIGDRAYMQPDRIAKVIDDGADILVRAGWKGARWQNAQGDGVDLVDLLDKAATLGRIDQPIWIGRRKAPSLALRLVAIKKPQAQAQAARRKARRAAQKEGCKISQKTLDAADWMILVTSLDPKDFPTDDILALYRLRWRIELAFKRLKSIIGLHGPPGQDERSAKPYILAHLLIILLLEPLLDAFEDSPHWPKTA